MTYQDILQLANGYAESKVLLTANDLGLFTAIGHSKHSSKALARKCRSNPEGMQLLLNALVGLNLLHVRSGRYWNRAIAQTYLDENSPKAITNLLWLLGHHWANWTDMTRVIMKGRPGWAPVTETKEFRRRFALAMHERSIMLAPLTLRTFRLPPGTKKFFDLAGGSGSYSIALAERNPKLSGVVLDQSVAVAKRLIKKQGLGGRLSVQQGDVFSAALPAESDAALVANIFHDFNVQENRLLLRRIRKALNPGGKVFIVEFFLDDTETKPVDAAVFSLLMYAFTDTGRSYSWRQVEGWLKAEGFGRCRRQVIAGSIGTLEATRL